MSENLALIAASAIQVIFEVDCFQVPPWCPHMKVVILNRTTVLSLLGELPFGTVVLSQ